MSFFNHSYKSTNIGWTGEKVVMVGDSAGGNLITSFSLKMIELDAARLPDALVPIYTPFLFQYLPSPSRVLSFSDVLLHMGVIVRCAAGWLCILDLNSMIYLQPTPVSALKEPNRR